MCAELDITHRLQHMMLPREETRRRTDTGPDGGGAPSAARRASSTGPSREDRVLSRVPPSRTCRTVASAQMVTWRPARAGPSQTCTDFS